MSTQQNDEDEYFAQVGADTYRILREFERADTHATEGTPDISQVLDADRRYIAAYDESIPRTNVDLSADPPTVTHTPPAIHVYVSTACVHGRHDECCRACKFCDATCACACGHFAQHSALSTQHSIPPSRE